MIAGILLAAGSATRFGSNKLLVTLPDGTAIAVAAARNLLSGVDQGFAVVHPSNHQLADLLRAEGMQVIFCPDAPDGMGKSLSCGVAAAESAAAWVISLADMPFIQPETIRGVAALLRSGAPIAAPYCQGQRGHPIGFSREFHPGLISLSGDQGARHLLSAHASRIQRFECNDTGIFADIDTPSDLTGHLLANRV